MKKYFFLALFSFLISGFLQTNIFCAEKSLEELMEEILGPDEEAVTPPKAPPRRPFRRAPFAPARRPARRPAERKIGPIETEELIKKRTELSQALNKLNDLLIKIDRATKDTELFDAQFRDEIAQLQAASMPAQPTTSRQWGKRQPPRRQTKEQAPADDLFPDVGSMKGPGGLLALIRLSLSKKMYLTNMAQKKYADLYKMITEINQKLDTLNANIDAYRKKLKEQRAEVTEEMLLRERLLPKEQRTTTRLDREKEGLQNQLRQLYKIKIPNMLTEMKKPFDDPQLKKQIEEKRKAREKGLLPARGRPFRDRPSYPRGYPPPDYDRFGDRRPGYRPSRERPGDFVDFKDDLGKFDEDFEDFDKDDEKEDEDKPYITRKKKDVEAEKKKKEEEERKKLELKELAELVNDANTLIDKICRGITSLDKLKSIDFTAIEPKIEAIFSAQAEPGEDELAPIPQLKLTVAEIAKRLKVRELRPEERIKPTQKKEPTAQEKALSEKAQSLRNKFLANVGQLLTLSKYTPVHLAEDKAALYNESQEEISTIYKTLTRMSDQKRVQGEENAILFNVKNMCTAAIEAVPPLVKKVTEAPSILEMSDMNLDAMNTNLVHTKQWFEIAKKPPTTFSLEGITKTNKALAMTSWNISEGLQKALAVEEEAMAELHEEMTKRFREKLAIQKYLMPDQDAAWKDEVKKLVKKPKVEGKKKGKRAEPKNDTKEKLNTLRKALQRKLAQAHVDKLKGNIDRMKEIDPAGTIFGAGKKPAHEVIVKEAILSPDDITVTKGEQTNISIKNPELCKVQAYAWQIAIDKKIGEAKAAAERAKKLFILEKVDTKTEIEKGNLLLVYEYGKKTYYKVFKKDDTVEFTVEEDDRSLNLETVSWKGEG